MSPTVFQLPETLGLNDGAGDPGAGTPERRTLSGAVPSLTELKGSAVRRVLSVGLADFGACPGCDGVEDGAPRAGGGWAALVDAVMGTTREAMVDAWATAAAWHATIGAPNTSESASATSLSLPTFTS